MEKKIKVTFSNLTDIATSEKVTIELNPMEALIHRLNSTFTKADAEARVKILKNQRQS